MSALRITNSGNNKRAAAAYLRRTSSPDGMADPNDSSWCVAAPVRFLEGIAVVGEGDRREAMDRPVGQEQGPPLRVGIGVIVWRTASGPCGRAGSARR